MGEKASFVCIVFPVAVPAQGRLLPASSAELKESLGLRPMALAEVGKESDRPSLAILTDDEELPARVSQLAARCGLKCSSGAITPPRPRQEAGPGAAGIPLVCGTLVSGPRAGIEKVLEVLGASGDERETELARQGERALEGTRSRELRCGSRVLKLPGLDGGARPLVMGILNVTPDSFSDGGRFAGPEAAVARGVEMAEAGAEIIDVGGESTRPGSRPVALEEESRRVLPVLEALSAKIQAVLSIDTTKAEVARRAVASGATLINDISGMTMDPLMPALAASLGVPVVLNHLRGVPATMQERPTFQHVVLEVLLDLHSRVRNATRAGVRPSRIVVDPGIGFGKRVTDNLALIRHLGIFRSLGAPVLVGVSRKSFLGALADRAPSERLPASLAAEVVASMAGAEIIRTHDPKATIDALRIAAAMGGDAASH